MKTSEPLQSHFSLKSDIKITFILTHIQICYKSNTENGLFYQMESRSIMYGKEQLEHSTKYLILCSMEERHAGLELLYMSVKP